MYGKSGIVVDELLLGRPYDGVAIFNNKNMKCFISEVEKIKECALFCENLRNIQFYVYQFACHMMREKTLMNDYCVSNKSKGKLYNNWRRLEHRFAKMSFEFYHCIKRYVY